MKQIMLICTLISCLFWWLPASIHATDQRSEQLYTLNGEWTFYHNHLLEPVDLNKERHDGIPMQVPLSWNKQLHNGKPLSNKGFGTYHYSFSIPTEHIGQQKALSLYYISSAYRIWINGKEYNGLGVVGKSPENETPHLQQQILTFQPTTDKIELVIQVSNFSFRDGGILSEIIYGDAATLHRKQFTKTMVTYFTTSGSLIFGIYHVVIYLWNRSNTSLLYLGLFSIFSALHYIFLMELVVFTLFPTIQWTTFIKLEYLVDPITALSIVLLFRTLFPNEISLTFVRIIQYIVVLIFSIVLFTPTDIFTHLLMYYPFILIWIFYIISSASIKALIRKKDDAVLNFASTFIIIIANIHDVLNYLNLLHTMYIANYATLVFILLQAIIVANRYRRMFEKTEKLTEELAEINATLETKIKQRTQELEEKNIALQNIQETRTRLLANIAHDIGSPIVGVQTYLQILKDDQIEVDRPHIFSQMIDRLSYVKKLNADLLTLSKLESQQLPLNFEEVEVVSFFNHFYDSLILEQRHQHISFHKEIDNVSPNATIYIDRNRIRQALQNYMDNAIKFSADKQTLITLRCTEQGNTITFAVQDNGNGIAPDLLPHIFERFFKQREANTSGTGLGLAIVKEIVEQHNGQVGVQSTEHKGSTFYLTLPLSVTRQLPPDDF